MNELKQITYAKAREMIKNHTLWLRGSGNNKDKDFSNINFSIEEWEPENNQYEQIFYNVFQGANLSEANFKNSDIRYISFKGANLKGTDLRNTKYNTDQFTEKQINEAILTNHDYKIYQKNKKLEKENEKLKGKVIEKEEIIYDIGEEKTHELLKSFKKIKGDFELEEKGWIMTSMTILTIFTLHVSSPILTKFLSYNSGNIISFQISASIFLFIILISMLIHISLEKKGKLNENGFIKKDKKDKGYNYLFIGIFSISVILFIWLNSNINGEKDIFSYINFYYSYGLIGMVIFSFLYFSIFQYSKSKQLRIENQNKITLLEGFLVINSMDSIKDKSKFNDNIANVVFTKVYNSKEKDHNLPVDKIIDIVNIVNKNKD